MDKPTTTPVAVIDLGTNTFHLLIARQEEDGSFKELHRERRYIKLAEAGIERIGAAPFARGLQALRDFALILERKQVRQVRAIGTAALRTAANGSDFVTAVREQTGIDIQLISGSEEARLIAKGVQRAIPSNLGNHLIMDIGGGSVEFILCIDREARWAKSYPIGVAVLYRSFHRTEPITAAEQAELRTFLSGPLTEIKAQLEQHPINRLIGAAGTFDVIADMLGRDRPTAHCTRVHLSRLGAFNERIIGATKEERHAMPEIPSDRADMIVVALILVEEVLALLEEPELLVSDYSLKEGVLSEIA